MPAGPTEPIDWDTIRVFSSGGALELHGGRILHTLTLGDRLDVEYLDLRNEQVREDHHVWSALDEDLLRGLTVLRTHRRHIVRYAILGRAEPLHRLVHPAELRAQIVLTVPISESSCHRCRGVAVELTDVTTGDREDRSVNELRVISVGFVLGQQLPVCARLMAQPSGGQLDLTLRGQTCEPIDLSGRIAEVFEECRPVLGKTAEHETVVHGDARHLAHVQVQLALASVPPLVVGVTEHLAVVAVRPPVVRTPERTRVSRRFVAHQVRSMRTSIEQEMNLAVLVARHDDVLQAELLADVVIGLGNLTGMPDEHPGAVPDPLQLVGEDIRIGVKRSVDALGLDQGVVVDARRSVRGGRVRKWFDERHDCCSDLSVT